jgi:hypothetical protein
MTLADILKGHTAAEILCAYTHAVVRRLVVNVDVGIVDMDAGEGHQVGIPLDTEITYEPWFMDRGSLLFANPIFGAQPAVWKLCTEHDVIRFDDGTEVLVCTDDSRGMGGCR